MQLRSSSGRPQVGCRSGRRDESGRGVCDTIVASCSRGVHGSHAPERSQYCTMDHLQTNNWQLQTESMRLSVLGLIVGATKAGTARPLHMQQHAVRRLERSSTTTSAAASFSSPSLLVPAAVYRFYTHLHTFIYQAAACIALFSRGLTGNSHINILSNGAVLTREHTLIEYRYISCTFCVALQRRCAVQLPRRAWVLPLLRLRYRCRLLLPQALALPLAALSASPTRLCQHHHDQPHLRSISTSFAAMAATTAPPAPFSNSLKQLREEGNKAFKSGNYAAALELYSQALAASKAEAGGGNYDELVATLHGCVCGRLAWGG